MKKIVNSPDCSNENDGKEQHFCFKMLLYYSTVVVSGLNTNHRIFGVVGDL